MEECHFKVIWMYLISQEEAYYFILFCLRIIILFYNLIPTSAKSTRYQSTDKTHGNPAVDWQSDFYWWAHISHANHSTTTFSTLYMSVNTSDTDGVVCRRADWNKYKFNGRTHVSFFEVPFNELFMLITQETVEKYFVILSPPIHQQWVSHQCIKLFHWNTNIGNHNIRPTVPRKEFNGAFKSSSLSCHPSARTHAVHL